MANTNFTLQCPRLTKGQLWSLVYSCESLARFLRCVRNSWNRLWEAYRKSNVDFRPKKGHAKGLKKESIRTHNHPSMSRWCHFWDGG